MMDICNSVTPYQLEWIADNREYGEKERYRKKEELKNTLISSDIISEERKKIEKLFLNNDLETAVKLYKQLFFEIIKELNSQYEEIFSIPQDLNNLKKYWRGLEKISDLDNAHAMYLSSNNWEFSVFNTVIEKLMTLLDNDYSKLNSILCAGAEDVRSALFSTFDNSWDNMMKSNFYQRIITEHDYIRENGICPCFAYISLSAPKLTNIFNEEKYNSDFLELKNNMDSNKKLIFENIFDLYCTLYYIRNAYDTYEYFGYFAFTRNYAIYVTYNLLAEVDSDKANQFKYFATTYQFKHIRNIL
jgi:hypothetical protein